MKDFWTFKSEDKAERLYWNKPWTFILGKSYTFIIIAYTSVVSLQKFESDNNLVVKYSVYFKFEKSRVL